MTRAARSLVLLVAAALLPAPAPASGDRPDCAPIAAVLEQAPSRFAALAGNEYSTRFDARRATTTLPGFDSCWVDDVTRSFWCLRQSASPAEAGREAAAQAELVDRCWPGVRTRQDIERGDDNVTRLVQDWLIPDKARLRLVQRRPTTGQQGLGSVFLYVH
ncbi:MAG: hypothetical protein ACKOGH_02205 [Alphaproteobacteria bacterium]